jgi:hypothetical protein
MRRMTGLAPAMKRGPRIGAVPPSVQETSPSAFGVMAGTVTEIRDTLVPLAETEWEALR